MQIHLACWDHVLFRGSVLVAVAALTSACNTVLGVEDVALDCHVQSDYPRADSSTVPARLIHFTDGNLTGPELEVRLETVADVELVVRLYNNTPPHGVLDAPGTYQLVTTDAVFDTCGVCVGIDSYFPSSAGEESWRYQAFGQGSMTLTVANSTRLSGSLHDLKFRHVMTRQNATDVELNDGCLTSVEDVEFDVPFQ